ncbi:MAG: serine protease [Methyloceanibacter sp.]
MRRVQVLTASLLMAVGISWQLSAGALADDNEMIVNGKEAPDGKYPYQVRLYSSTEDEYGFCGGSIIAPQWVLTASHCVTEGDLNTGPTTQKDPEDIVVGYGSNDRTQTKRIQAVKIFATPEFLEKGLSGKHDVALIKLAEPIQDAPVITLADPATDKSIASAGAKLTVTGWGALWSPYDKDVAALMPDLGEGKDMSDKINFPVKLREVEIEAMDNGTCNTVFAGDKLSVADTEICAMYQGTTKASCQGDSGGPLVVATPSGFAQVGVVSWGTICGNTVTPSVFSRVSSFNDWINDTMKNN